MLEGNPIRDLLRRWRLKRRARKIEASPLFDADWYRKRYPDAGDASLDPALHYIVAGAAEGRRPHPLFDPGCYRANNPDVADEGRFSNQLIPVIIDIIQRNFGMLGAAGAEFRDDWSQTAMASGFSGRKYCGAGSISGFGEITLA